jgi:hypothetical protein
VGSARERLSDFNETQGEALRNRVAQARTRVMRPVWEVARDVSNRVNRKRVNRKRSA